MVSLRVGGDSKDLWPGSCSRLTRESFFTRRSVVSNFPCIDGCILLTKREISKIKASQMVTEEKSQNGSVSNGWLSTFIAVGDQPSDPCYTLVYREYLTSRLSRACRVILGSWTLNKAGIF